MHRISDQNEGEDVYCSEELMHVLILKQFTIECFILMPLIFSICNKDPQ